MLAMNACSFCKHGKRKCNKARPTCANCARLGRNCVYTEDSVQTHFEAPPRPRLPQLDSLKSFSLHIADSPSDIDTSSPAGIARSTVDFVVRIFGSPDSILSIADEFFIGTHQRICAVSKHRFHRNLQVLSASPRADFAALCLCILLVQQRPADKAASMQSALYFNVKNLITLLETTSGLSLDLVHCRLLVAFYELGHGLHTAAYISIAACARAARALGLHRKRWRNRDPQLETMMALEEEKRTWWAVLILDRFISLCNGDPLLATSDAETTDPLPIDDLLWSESLDPADLEGPLNNPPLLDTPFNVTVGQMARECQVAHLAGRVIQHVFDPTPDPNFNAEAARQLERTLRAYLPLLADEELKIGKYCGGFGMCNSALFLLYQFKLDWKSADTFDRQQIQEDIEETALRALNFAAAAYLDRAENYPFEILSPYLPYSLCQAAVIDYRLWKRKGDPIYKERHDKLKKILREFTHRWTVAWQYLEILDNITDTWPSMVVPVRGFFVATGDTGYRA